MVALLKERHEEQEKGKFQYAESELMEKACHFGGERAGSWVV